MSILALHKKMSSTLLKDLEGFDMIIFEDLEKSLEYVSDRVPIQQNNVHV